MKKRVPLFFAFVLLSPLPAHAAASVRIVQLSGEVKIRRAVEEKWEAAATGMLLEESDTIMTLERGEVLLELATHATFRLGGNALLEVADLREISERQLFLWLMSEKVGKLKPRSEKIPLHLGEVSSPRGANASKDSARVHVRPTWRMEVNAAQALRAQNFLPNAALLLHRVQTKHSQREDCGEVSFELAQAFEALRQIGRARDEYQTALTQTTEQQCDAAAAKMRRAAITTALQRLK